MRSAGILVPVKRHPRPFWEKLVAEVEAGSAMAAVARRHSVRATTLRWWRTQIRKRVRASSVRIIPVTIPPFLAPERLIEMAVGELVLRVQVGTSVDYVAALVRALKQEC